MSGTIVTVLALLIWLYLLTWRGGFWLAADREEREPRPTLPEWPSVVAVIPARDEAESIGNCVSSLMAQDYPGEFRLVVVDDNSTDGTAEVAGRAAASAQVPDRLSIVTGRPLPPGWTGKLWAVKQGIDQALSLSSAPSLLLLTDADIRYRPDVLRDLVARAVSDGRVLSSLMVKLRCENWVEAAFVPAFVFFFQMLYPFRWSNDPHNATAAAAGGCMLVRAEALRTAGGIEAIRGALIDDCALARLLKPHGPIRLALTDRVDSLREYLNLAEFGGMVTRTAYTQLGYSPLMLLGVVLAMMLVYLAGPLFAIFGSGWPQIIGAIVWVLIAISYQPILRFYRLSPLWGFALPAIAFTYMAWTIDSALRYARGTGGGWKGRAQAHSAELP